MPTTAGKVGLIGENVVYTWIGGQTPSARVHNFTRNYN